MGLKRRDHVDAPPTNTLVSPLPERRCVGRDQRVYEHDGVTTLVQHAADQLVPIVRAVRLGAGPPRRMWTGPPPKPGQYFSHAPTVSTALLLTARRRRPAARPRDKCTRPRRRRPSPDGGSVRSVAPRPRRAPPAGAPRSRGPAA